MLRLAAAESWEVSSLDITAAFLYADLPQDSPSFIVRPASILVALDLVSPSELWLVHKALYGLRLAPRAWGSIGTRSLGPSVGTLFNPTGRMRADAFVSAKVASMRACGSLFVSASCHRQRRS